MRDLSCPHPKDILVTVGTVKFPPFKTWGYFLQPFHSCIHLQKEVGMNNSVLLTVFYNIFINVPALKLFHSTGCFPRCNRAHKHAWRRKLLPIYFPITNNAAITSSSLWIIDMEVHRRVSVNMRFQYQFCFEYGQIAFQSG